MSTPLSPDRVGQVELVRSFQKGPVTHGPRLIPLTLASSPRQGLR